MQITVKNIRGVVEADFSVATIALIAAPNRGGKSSIAQAVAAALTQNPSPIIGLDKKDAGKLLRTGSKRGAVTITDSVGEVTVNYPGGSINVTGEAPQASVYAAGLASIFDMPAKLAAPALMESIQARPVIDDLTAAATEHGFTLETVEQLWKLIAENGWDATFKTTKEKGTKAKGAWEETTGENYGSVKAEGWRSAILPVEPVAESDILAGLDELQIKLDAAIKNQASDQSLIAELESQIAGRAELQQSLSTKNAETEAQRGIVDGLETQLRELPRPIKQNSSVPCPHCKNSVEIDGNKLRIAEPFDQIDAAYRQQAISAATEGLNAARQRFADANADEISTMRQVRELNAIEQRIATLKSAGTSTPEELATIRARIARGNTLLDALRKTDRAAKLHLQIKGNALIQEMLAPTGVRQTVLQAKLSKINTRFAALCEVAAWPLVRIEDDLSITCGGVIRELMCESEKFRCRAVLQLTIADIDQSEMVIIDAADILDRAGRNGLFAMLVSAGITAIVCMTMNAVADVPSLAAAGIGESFFIGGGYLVPVAG